MSVVPMIGVLMLAENWGHSRLGEFQERQRKFSSHMDRFNSFLRDMQGVQEVSSRTKNAVFLEMEFSDLDPEAPTYARFLYDASPELFQNNMFADGVANLERTGDELRKNDPIHVDFETVGKARDFVTRISWILLVEEKRLQQD